MQLQQAKMDQFLNLNEQNHENKDAYKSTFFEQKCSESYWLLFLNTKRYALPNFDSIDES